MITRMITLQLLTCNLLSFFWGGDVPKPYVEEISSEVFFMGGIENSGFLVQVGEEVERALKNFTPKVGPW
jgi:hypothetical protein